MRRLRGIATVLAVGALATGLAVGAADVTTSEIRIGLPEGFAGPVSVEPGPARVVLDLPKGATLPVDFVAASGGLLREGVVTALPGDRLRVELQLATGLLDRVSFEGDAVVVRFESRFRSTAGTDDPAERYTLGVGDRVKLAVHGHPDLTTDMVVDPSGTVMAPLVGEIRAVGTTVRELGDRIAELLGRDYFVDPQVDAQVSEYNSQWVTVTGEVRTPQKVALKGGTKLKEAIAEAGGLTDDAGETILISRTAGDGVPSSISVERPAFERGEANPVLVHGDVVSIERASYCYVNGEVRSPGKIRLERGLTLLRALTQAGGLTEWANRKEVRVIREGVADSPVTVFNLNKIMEGKAEDPPLRGGDVVVVKRRFL